MPYRAEGNAIDAPVRVLLVTSRENKRWVIPKGNPMTGREAHAAAALEAEEEAGVCGLVCPTPLGSYRYRKRRGNGASLMFELEAQPGPAAPGIGLQPCNKRVHLRRLDQHHEAGAEILEQQAQRGHQLRAGGGRRDREIRAHAAAIVVIAMGEIHREQRQVTAADATLRRDGRARHQEAGRRSGALTA